MGDNPKPRPCATESCDRPAVIRFERGNVGSDYCAHCYAKLPLPEAPK